MPIYHKYQMDDGSTVLTETKLVVGGVVKASRSGSVDMVETGKKYTSFLASIISSFQSIQQL